MDPRRAISFATFDIAGESTDREEAVDVRIEHTFQKPVYSHRGSHRWVSRWDRLSEEWSSCVARLGRSTTCGLSRLKPGEYVVDATLRSDPNARTVLRFRVAGEDEDIGGSKPFIEVRAPKHVLSSGDVAEVEVRTKRDVAGVLFVERYGIQEAIPFRTRRRSAKLAIPVERWWAPEMRMHAWVVNHSGETPWLDDAVATVDVEANSSPSRWCGTWRSTLPSRPAWKESIPL